jgi:cytosine/uracil/thiamine/allantoin permease
VSQGQGNPCSCRAVTKLTKRTQVLTGVPQWLLTVYSLAWFVGTAAAAAVYCALMLPTAGLETSATGVAYG